MIEFSFKNQFAEIANWADDCSHDQFTTMLKSSYPLFYKGNSNVPDYGAIREELKKVTSIKDLSLGGSKQARELIKNLFRIPYKCIKETECKQSSFMSSLQLLYGQQIIAHGVEEAKGGLSNILLMLVSNKVLAARSYWGAFLEGPPNVSPLCHGPYYLIYSTQGIHPPSKPDFSSIEYILVPFPEHIELLQGKVESMVAVNLVTESEQKSFLKKLKDYEGFLNLLKSSEATQEAQQPAENPNEQRLTAKPLEHIYAQMNALTKNRAQSTNDDTLLDRPAPVVVSRKRKIPEREVTTGSVAKKPSLR